MTRPSSDAAAVMAVDRTWSWAELDARAAAVAAAVTDRGVRPGERIGLLAAASAPAIAALVGLPRAGIQPVVVHPRLAPPEIAGILEAARCRLLVLDTGPGPDLPAGVDLLDLTEVAATEVSTTADPLPSTDPVVELVVPTSGTTARPKLARLPLARIQASAEAWNAFLPPASGWLLSLGLGHVAGIGIVARARASGTPIVVPETTDAVDLLGAIDAARARGVAVSHLSLVATQLERILAALADAPPPDGIRAVLLGGGPIPEALVTRALDAGWPVVPSYGMTETASGIAAARPDEARARPWSAGRVLPGTELRIDRLDPSGGAAQPDEVGGIAVRGPTTFPGYLDDPAATAAVIGPDGWLRTGDLGSLDADGYLRVVDRLDDLIVSGGENVAPAEVEAALASHPGVADVGVVGAADPTWGRVPVAYVVAGRPAPSDDELRTYARARLAPFKVPARFVRVEALPRSPSGKLLRRRLPDVEPSSADGEPRRRVVTTDDEQAIAIQVLAGPAGPDRTRLPVVLLHATLSSSAQLTPLARRVSATTTAILVDRRGSGGSEMADPRPVPVGRHVADVIAVLDAVGLERAALVGHSFGGVVALETAARHPDRVAAVLAWEPPYLPLADAVSRRVLASVADRVGQAYAAGGSEAAARVFLGIVSGPEAWDRLHPRQRSAIARQGTGAVADVAMEGLDPDRLATIVAPTVLATGSASQPFYAPIADALATRIGSATRIDLDGLRHPAPITDPARIADLVLALLDRAGRPLEPAP